MLGPVEILACELTHACGDPFVQPSLLDHHESRRQVFPLDILLGLVRSPRYAPRLPPPCQSAVAWKYNPC